MDLAAAAAKRPLKAVLKMGRWRALVRWWVEG